MFIQFIYQPYGITIGITYFCKKLSSMKNILFFISFLLFSNILFSQDEGIIHHQIKAIIQPENSDISVIDSIYSEKGIPSTFLLNSVFVPRSLTKGVQIKKVKVHEKAQDVGMDRDTDEDTNGLELTKWEIKGSAPLMVISYEGKIADKIEDTKANYQRGFSESAGIINKLGVYLAGSTYWVPVFDHRLMTFSLTTELPKTWKNVSQGMRSYEESKGDKHLDTWVCDSPQEEIFLIAAQFTEYSHDMNSGIKAMAFLRTPDEGLANKYLEVTEQYMEMYQGMLGAYPYKKFALVENFWETGYGMPSFTLLGEKIIRFPFILHSSYPHELLHNWWGNSVYVDFSKGNWCEGTTAFMADHLIKEQRGAGEEYRRSTLQKFSNFVTPENDFPLSIFSSRSDGPSEAIGYGKALMTWQMLRRKLGDETFLKGMRLFYQDNKYQHASYDDIQHAMEQVSGMDLSAFFKQWINRLGAPEIAIENISTNIYGGKYRVDITLVQKQEAAAFDIDIPINIATEKGLETFVFNMAQKQQNYQISLQSKPLKLAVDPQYDVFRILNPAEVPPSLSKVWGSAENVFILPSKASKEKLANYQKFANDWIDADNDHFSIVADADIEELPKDKTAWVLGFDNLFASAMNEELADLNSKMTNDSVFFEKKALTRTDNSFVFTLTKKENINQQNIFISIGNEQAIAGLIRKLPHYGKYSYLAFNDAEPTNIAKGQWPIMKSPLVKTFVKGSEKLSVTEAREALASLKAVFSENRMMETIKYLSSPELKGRGLGTPELNEAANYIAAQFKEAGLQPMGKDYFQKFTHDFKDKGRMNLTNVIGMIPGTDAQLKDEVVVVSAHYDHLGFGWPDVHKGDEGKIHPGADDNASGISCIIELARNMAKTVKPKRSIVFLACSGEEAGLIGSRYFVEHRKEYFKGEIFADLNLDTEGSLFDTKILVLNANSAKEWKFIFMGTDYTTGVKSEVIDKELDASDQVSFIEAGIPAVQLFTGPTLNYHRPTDTYEKIDGKGLVKVAIVSKEVIEYLADREDPMHYTGPAVGLQKDKAPAVAKKSRQVSTGSVPDFSYGGSGVRISSVIPGSAGEKAGLQANDVIQAVDGVATDDLKAYSDMLKKYQPGDTIKLKVLRGKEVKSLSIVLGER
jgi:hypothetical protein